MKKLRHSKVELAEACAISFPCDFLKFPKFLPTFLKIIGEYHTVDIFVESK